MSDDKVKSLIHKIGLKYNLRDNIVNKIVNSPYRFTREIMTHLDFEKIKNEDDFKNLKTNFIYQYIGKIYTQFSVLERHRGRGFRLKNMHNLKKNNDE
jgi:uncharacterized protein YpuA (DUF1002 family)